MSATKEEIFIPEDQLPIYRAALQKYVLTDPSPLTERDFRRRAAAYTPSPPSTKYKDILRMVEMDLKALQDPLPAAPREA